MEQAVLSGTITFDAEEQSDGMSVRFSAPPNLGLGMLARARYELDALEKQVHAELAKKPRGK